jgi:hypothetical protein
MTSLLTFLCCLIVPPGLFAQADSTTASTQPFTPTDSSRLDGGRLAIVGGTVVAAVTAIHMYQHDAWWKGARSSFHVEEDLTYARNIDKLGHFCGANATTFLLSRGLQWAHVPETQSLIWGAVGSTLFESYIEIEDGFSAYWGFDRVDFAADLLGAWYPVAQHFVPPLRNFNMRVSYLPKTEGSQGAIPGQTHTIFDDYEGQTFWLTLTMKNLLPDAVAHYWPDFLCLSLGVAVRDNNSVNRRLDWFIAPDLDMTKIIPPDTAFLKSLGEALNLLHFPMPAVRISPGVIWYGLYF